MTSKANAILPPIDLRGPQRRALSQIYAVCGLFGVREWIIRYAGEQAPAASWSKVLGAGGSGLDRGGLIDFYLGHMHPALLESLIEGTITRRDYHDKDFAYHLRLHRLDEKPSTYLNVVCRLGFEEQCDTQQSTERDELSRFGSFGASPFEILEVCKLMIRYTDYHNTATNDEAAELDTRFLRVDRAHRPSNGFRSHLGGRRYLLSNRSVQRIKNWVGQTMKVIVRPAQARMSAQQFKRPLGWCFHEVGFGVHGQARATDHLTHKGTNYLFGLYTAAMQYTYPNVFDIKQYRLNYVAEPEHADIVEIINSMVGFSYSHEGGLNPALAGGASLSGETAITDASFDQHWRDAQALMAEADLMTKSRKVDAKKRHDYLNLVSGAKELAMQRNAEAKQEIDSLKLEIQSKKRKLKAYQDENLDQDLMDALDEDFRKCENLRQPQTPIKRETASPSLGEVGYQSLSPSPPGTT
jgi:hypothetical protein